MDNHTSPPAYDSEQVVEAKPAAYALVFYAIGVLFWAGLLAFAASAAASILCQTHEVIQTAGEAVVVILSLLQVIALTRFPLKTTVDGDRLTTISLRGRKTIKLSSITDMRTAVLVAGRGRSIDCLKCRDASGEVVFLQLGCLPRSQRTVLFAPLVRGFKVSSPQAANDVAYLWHQWYRYPDAPADPAFPGSGPHPHAKRNSIIAISVLAVFYVLLLAGLPYGYIHINRALSTHNLRAASPVANEYIHDLSIGDIAAVTKLESPKFQENVMHRQFLYSVHFRSSETFRQTDSYAGNDKHGAYAVYVYEADAGRRPYYLKIALSKYNGEWRVWFLQTAYTALRASPN